MRLQHSSCTRMLHPAQVKEKFRQRDESFKPFAGKTMAMIFTKPSMRTRISFETVRMQYLHARKKESNQNLGSS